MGKESEGKAGLVFCIQPAQYEIFDYRINKPICIKQIDKGVEVGSMVFQEIDTIKFPKNDLEYFPPNNVAMLLSVAQKSLNEGREIFDSKIDPNKIEHSVYKSTENKKQFLIDKSVSVADYIEKIQSSLVFGYTALEAFCNLSIPDDYEYQVLQKNKGIREVYDKVAIERWLTLKIKISKILVDVYKTTPIEKQKFWSQFDQLEKYRHSIIHQKSISRTEFYKAYFRKDIFRVCQSAEAVIKFFYEKQASDKKTNLLWPWLINKDKEFPLTTDYQSDNFEVIGNLFDGKKK